MKYFKLSCLLVILITSNNLFSQVLSIFANVDGDVVTLWETCAQRNCGAYYDMKIVQDDHYMKWYQVDNGEVAFCLCVFDLSVTYGPLEPGDYSVDVYYTVPYDSAAFYEGSTTFTIGNSREVGDAGIISQYQSDCFSGVDDPEANNDNFRIYPVPLRDGGLLHLEAFPAGGKTIFEILTLTGKLVYSKQYDGNSPINDQFIKDELFLVSGLYLVRLRSDNQVYIRKISVL